MKISVQTTDLKKYLGIVNRGVSARPQLPVLSGIMVKALDGVVNFVSTDLEISFWVSVPASIEEEGELIVPAKLFSDLVSGLPSGKVTLTSDKNSLRVETKGINAEVVGQGAEDYPAIPRASKTQLIIGAGEFRQKIDRVCISSAKDDTRPVLTGVLWEIGGEKIVLAATDGYRLSVDKLSISKSNLTNSERFILPARSLQEISKVLSETGEDSFGVEFDKENQQVIFKVGDIEVTSRLIAGEFPPYQQIMPNTYSTRVLFGKVELLEAVKRASLFARDNANIIKMSTEEGRFVVRSESSQLGNNATELEMEIEGNQITVAFNARYLLDYLGVSTSEKIIWETEGELKPSVFVNEDDTDWTHVIMPVRVQS